jgi:prepilin-type N-terminal cleavage/methylation domain-containing protein
MREKYQRINMQRQKGFSLIELLIVVAIILIIAAIAIPNLLRAKISADESSAVASVRQLSTAQITYATSYQDVGFAANLAALGPGSDCSGGPTSTNACIIDTVLASGSKSGYSFLSIGSGGGAGVPNGQVVSSSAPLTFNVTGVRNFCMVTDGVLRINSGPVAIAPDVPTCVAYPIAQ